MNPDDPRHGSNAGYLAHYREGEKPCAACGEARRIAQKRASVDRKRGTPRIVPLGTRAWNILHTHSHNQLDAATGIRPDKLARYHAAGPSQRVHRRTRDRLLAVGLQEFWTPVGIQRRVRALAALGWSSAEVARRTSLSVDAVRRMARRHDPVFVRRSVAALVLTTYADLHMVSPPPSRSVTHVRERARRNGWAPPLAYDDIDDPSERPKVGNGGVSKDDVDPQKVERVINGDRLPLTTAERRVIVNRMRAAGWSLVRIERHTGITKAERYVERREGAA